MNKIADVANAMDEYLERAMGIVLPRCPECGGPIKLQQLNDSLRAMMPGYTVLFYCESEGLCGYSYATKMPRSSCLHYYITCMNMHGTFSEEQLESFPVPKLASGWRGDYKRVPMILSSLDDGPVYGMRLQDGPSGDDGRNGDKYP